MSKLTVVKTSSGALTLKASVDAVSVAARALDAAVLLQERAREHCSVLVDCANPSTRDLDAIQELLHTAAKELTAVPDHLLEPADLIDIAAAVDKLIGWFPQRPHDPAAYAEGLCDEIVSLEPSRAALLVGLQWVRGSCTFLPAAAEVRAKVLVAKKCGSNIRSLLDRRRAQLAEARRRRAAWDAYNEARERK